MTAEAPTTGSRLREVRVLEAMHPGVISCPPDSTLQTVARMMAAYGVHAVLVHGREAADGDGWGVITDWQLLQAAAAGNVHTIHAAEVATSPVVGIPTSEPLQAALELMAETGASHVLAVERHSGRPVGVVSTLDVVRALAELA